MKKGICCLLLLITQVGFAQIVINNDLVWQQYIPLITGGKSIQISNIQITGASNAFGYYQAFNHELDLSQGIVMTSGVAVGPDGPLGPNNLPNAGLDNGTSGNYLADQIGGLPSYNTSAIEFDFSSPVEDTLQMSYLFGSEEYKEYVGSEFNDVFGFFVTAGPGITAPVNIAMVPGTTTPITINNVNHLTNSSYYHDNELPTPGTILQYDGYVRLETDPFPIIPGQTYHIILLVSDISDGVFDSGVFLELKHGKQNICGQIFYEGLPAGPGTVELIGYRQNEINIEVLDTAFTNSNGEFSFDSVGFGGYRLRSVLNPIDYPLAYPVYLDSAVIWNMASIKYLPTLDTSCYTLYHKELPIGSGPGTITGLVFNDNLIKHIGLISGGTPCFIFALNELGNVAAYSNINAKGEYSLSGLNEGTYTLLIDYLGYDMLDTNWITISTNSYTHTANYLAKNKEKVIHRLLEDPGQSNEFYTITYPNPSNGDFNLYIHSPEFIREMEVSVYDSRGRIIYTQTLFGITEGQSFYRFDLAESNPSDGVYIIRMQSELYKNISKILINR